MVAGLGTRGNLLKTRLYRHFKMYQISCRGLKSG